MARSPPLPLATIPASCCGGSFGRWRWARLQVRDETVCLSRTRFGPRPRRPSNPRPAHAYRPQRLPLPPPPPPPPPTPPPSSPNIYTCGLPPTAPHPHAPKVFFINGFFVVAPSALLTLETICWCRKPSGSGSRHVKGEHVEDVANAALQGAKKVMLRRAATRTPAQPRTRFGSRPRRPSNPRPTHACRPQRLHLCDT